MERNNEKKQNCFSKIISRIYVSMKENAINSNLVDSERNRIIEDNNKNKIPIKIIGLKKTYWFCCKKNIRAIN